MQTKKEVKNLLIGLFLLIFAYSCASTVIEYFYDKTFFGCRPLFRHPLWDISIAFSSSLFAVSLFVKFREKYTIRYLFVVFTLFYLFKMLLEWIYVYSFSMGYFMDIFFEIYYRDEMLLFALNFFSFGFLYMKKK